MKSVRLLVLKLGLLVAYGQQAQCWLTRLTLCIINTCSFGWSYFTVKQGHKKAKSQGHNLQDQGLTSLLYFFMFSFWSDIKQIEYTKSPEAKLITDVSHALDADVLHF